MKDLAEPLASQVVLIGAAAYRHLDRLEGVVGNLRSLSEMLCDAELWGVPAENCHVLLDPPDVPTVVRTLRRAAAAVGDHGILLVYYAGHGLIDPSDGTLVLALPDCEPAVPHEAGLPYEWLRRAVLNSVAYRRVVILDCCYAGRAAGEMGTAPTDSAAVADEIETDETCLLVSASRNRTASAPEGEPYTAFTGELVRVIRDGLDDGTPVLTIDAIWRHLRRELQIKGHERPELRQHNAGGSIALVHNAATKRKNLAGSILIAANTTRDPQVAESAILILRHNDTGALGIRINTPARPIPDEYPGNWRSLLQEPVAVFDGGPVARDGYITVALLRPSAPTPLRFTPIRDRLGTLALSSAPEDLTRVADGMRVFAGYLGWRPGEVEAYLDDGELIRTSHTARQVFTERPRELWRSLRDRP